MYGVKETLNWTGEDQENIGTGEKGILKKNE